MPKKFSWSAPSLKGQEKRLVNAYQKIGKPLDALPYTDDFDRLVQDVKNAEPTPEKRRELFRQLLNLRKRARLPRSSFLIDVSGETEPLSAEDEMLVSAYLQVGKPLDMLPYTSDFETLIDQLGRPKTQAIRHAVFRRLLHLRKTGRLPSNRSPTESGN